MQHINTNNVFSSGQKHGDGFPNVIFRLFFFTFCCKPWQFECMSRCQTVGSKSLRPLVKKFLHLFWMQDYVSSPHNWLFSPSPVKQLCYRCTAILNISRRKARAHSGIKLLRGILWYHCIQEIRWVRIKTRGNNIRIVQAQQITMNRGMVQKKRV